MGKSFVHQASVTIASGTSLSPAVIIGGEFSIIGIEYPAAWDAADVTFQISLDEGTTWKELLDDSGTAIQKTVTAAQYRELDSAEFKSAVQIKVRSGTASVAVNQTADRLIKLFSRRYIAR